MRSSGSTLLESWATSPSSPQRTRRQVLSPLGPSSSTTSSSIVRTNALPASDSALDQLKLTMQRQQQREQQSQHQQLPFHHHQQQKSPSAGKRRRDRQTRLHEHLKVVKRSSVSPGSIKPKSFVGQEGPSPSPVPSPTTLTGQTPPPPQQQQQSESPISSSSNTGPVEGSTRATAAGMGPTVPATSRLNKRATETHTPRTTRRTAQLRSTTPNATTSGQIAAAAAASQATEQVSGALDEPSEDAIRLKTELAALGLMPSDDLFNATMSALEKSGIELTISNFLQTLATTHTKQALQVDTHVAASTTTLSTTSPVVQSATFSSLESPSTPTELQRNPLAIDPTSSPVRTQIVSSYEQLYSPRPIPPLLPPLEPATPRSQRLQAFNTVQTPPASRESEDKGRPSRVNTRQYTQITSANALASLSKPTMVAAQVEGMGRVALSRQVLVDQLGAQHAEQAIAAAKSVVDDDRSEITAVNRLQTFAPAFGSSKFEFKDDNDSKKALTTQSELKQIQVFDGPKLKIRTRLPRIQRRSGGKGGFHILNDKLGQVRSWLESDDEQDQEQSEEERRQTWIEAPETWHEDEKWDDDEAARVKQTRLEPALSLSTTVEDQDDEALSRQGDSQGRIRVGGKSVRRLLQTKRQRLLEDDAEQGHSRLSKGKSVAHQGVVNCTCGRIQIGDESEGMVQCDDCQDWLHLDCVGISSIKRVPSPWFCERCASDEGNRSMKRSKRAGSPGINVSPSTPVLASEPTLVATSFSPRPSGNFYRSNGGDLLLAPSPTASPTRRHVQVPRSPQHVAFNQAPATPKLSMLPKTDYTPRSPLFYRGGRSRVISGHYEEGSNWAGGGGGGWDGHNYGYDDQALLPTDEPWHDLTMTPSRTVSNTLEWETPGTTSRRASTVFGSGSGGGSGARPGSRSVAQDFLATLHHDEMQGTGGHSRAPSYSQRLFGSPVHQHSHMSPGSTPLSTPTVASMSPHHSLLAPHSPTMIKGGLSTRPSRARVPSIPFGFQPPHHTDHSASSMSALSASNPFALGHARMPSNPFTTSLNNAAGGGGGAHHPSHMSYHYHQHHHHQRLPSNGYSASLRSASPGHYSQPLRTQQTHEPAEG
ncbi:hypothetical protein OIO90_001981 [Microbotryomycetes sp. JL221]|nr:hypothetical protein OIO90_001981 [Microbotryomycetes sp. JL221]